MAPPILRPLKPYLLRVPGVGGLIRERFFRRNYPSEMALLGGRHGSKSDRPSVIFFTVHKCASVYASEILRKLAEDSGLTPIDFDSYFYLGGPSSIDVFHDTPRLGNIFKKRGYYFGPFRHPNRAIPDLHDFRVVLMLRDPRDVLTSLYYSIAYSHSVPEENPEQRDSLLRRREAARKMSIEEFVLAEAAPYLESYTIYCSDLVGKPFVHLTTYEEMLGDREAWLRKIAEFAGFDLKAETLSAALSELAKSDQPEKIQEHRRQVTPGDHKRKLKPETIAELNSRFGEVLNCLGYGID